MSPEEVASLLAKLDAQKVIADAVNKAILEGPDDFYGSIAQQLQKLSTRNTSGPQGIFSNLSPDSDGCVPVSLLHSTVASSAMRVESQRVADAVITYLSEESTDNPFRGSGKAPLAKAQRLLNGVDLHERATQNMKTGADGLPRPLIMAHRGASGYNLEHSVQGYDDAIAGGADYIEFDVVSTADHQLVIAHDITLEGVSDVASVFPQGEQSYSIDRVDGEVLDLKGWFAKDLTLEQVKQLQMQETQSHRVGGVTALRPERNPSQQDEKILTVLEAATYLEGKRAAMGRNFGLIIELKSPKWHSQVGLPLEQKLISDIQASGWGGPVILQCFEADPLRMVGPLMPTWSMYKLMVDVTTCDSVGIPRELALPVDEQQLRPYLTEVREYATMIGPWKGSLVPNPAHPPERCAAIDIAHELGLEVSCYTFRSDVKCLDKVYGGNATEEYAQFFSLGIDGVFSDFSDHARHARDVYFSLGDKFEFMPDAFAVSLAGDKSAQLRK